MSCIILSACSEGEIAGLDFKDDPKISTLKGTWKVVSYEDYDTKEILTKDEENSWGLDVVLTFDDQVTPHTISGTNTSNSISGKFSYTSKRTFELQQLASTYVGQPEWGNKFTRAVGGEILDFKLNTSGLRIYYNGKRKSVTLKRE